MMDYTAKLQSQFAVYREDRYSGRSSVFEDRPNKGPVVFRREFSSENILVPPFLDNTIRQTIIDKIPVSQRHRWFGSLQSSQALAQSIFGTIAASGRLGLLSEIVAEDGFLAFGPLFVEATLELEKSVTTLREPRPTSVDVWLEGSYKVAVECKLSESEFGTCSRTKLSPKAVNFKEQFCDGTYTKQNSRDSNCSLTEIGVSYWQYLDDLLGWSSIVEHRPCPLSSTYQLVRNLLAVCVDEHGQMHTDIGHVLTIYDERNPSMAADGYANRQWNAVHTSLKSPNLLRKLSWQSLISQWPEDRVLDWLEQELAFKFGIQSD